MLSVVSLLFFLLIIISVFINYRKGLQIYIVTFPFVQTYMSINLGMGLEFRVSAIIAILLVTYTLIYIHSNRRISELVEMPLNRVILGFCFIYSLSVSLNPSILESNIGPFLYFLLRTVALVYIGWMAFSSFEEANGTKRRFLIGIGLLTLYGLFEFALQANPILDYFARELGSDISSDEFSPILRYESDSRGYRVQSIFYHPYPWGGILSCLCLYPLFFLFKRAGNVAFEKYLLLYIVFIANIVLTRGRSTLLPALLVSGLSFLSSKGISKGKVAIIGFIMLGVLAIPLLFPSVIDQIAPYFSFSKNDDGLRGSSTEMRAQQLIIAVALVQDNIWAGNGFEYVRELLAQIGLGTPLSGVESFWLVILIENGIVGIISYLFLFAGISYYFLALKRHFATDSESRRLLNHIVFGIAAYVIFITTTGTMNTLPFFFLFIGAITKYVHLLKKREESKSVVTSAVNP